MHAAGDPTDLAVSSDDLQAWAGMTRAPFESFLFPGDHFFLSPSSGEILKIVEAKINGEEVEVVAHEPAAKVVDLMEALKASLAKYKAAL